MKYILSFFIAAFIIFGAFYLGARYEGSKRGTPRVEYKFIDRWYSVPGPVRTIPAVAETLRTVDTLRVRDSLQTNPAYAYELAKPFSGSYSDTAVSIWARAIPLDRQIQFDSVRVAHRDTLRTEYIETPWYEKAAYTLLGAGVGYLMFEAFSEK